MARFREWLPPDKPWVAVEADDFRDYSFKCMRDEWARATIRLYFAALRSFYKFLTRTAGFKINPGVEGQLPKGEKKLPTVLN